MSSLGLHLPDVSVNQYRDNSRPVKPTKKFREFYGVSKAFISISCLVFCKVCHCILLSVKRYSAVAQNHYTNSAPKGLKVL